MLIALLLAGAMALYAAIITLLWWGQERLLFQPQVLPADHRFQVGADVHETWLDVPGARLHALHLKLPDPKGVMFFLHGNAGSLENWFVDIDYFRRANIDLFMIDYRGYGKSSGRIQSQAQLEADVRAAWNHIAPAYAGKQRVIYGRSLGSGLAATLAGEVQPDLTVLVSAYSSMTELAAELYPWVPGFALRYPLRTGLGLAHIKGPVLLVHGERDTLISSRHSERLKALLPHAQLLLLPAAGHGDVQLFPAYLDAVTAAVTMPSTASQSSPAK